MITTIDVDPKHFAAFGEVTQKNAFILVTNRAIAEHFRLVEDPRYGSQAIVTYDSEEDFSSFLSTHTQNHAHILTVCPDSLITSVPRDILENRKLAIMACRSGKTPIEGIKHFLDRAGDMNVDAIQQNSDALFEQGQNTAYMQLEDERHQTRCIFHHLTEDYEWHEQVGYLEEGDQQVFPAGEVACFLVPLYTEQLPERNFDLNGKLVMTGPVIVQSGPPSFLLDDQLHIYEQLAAANNGGIELDVVQGRIVAHKALDDAALPAEHMLHSLFAVDSRYRNIYEVGFSMNPYLSVWPGNTAMNEVWGENGGNIHIGIGMLPYTQYHIDIFCANTVVKNDQGSTIFGGAKQEPARAMKRVKAVACPCNITL